MRGRIERWRLAVALAVLVALYALVAVGPALAAGPTQGAAETKGAGWLVGGSNPGDYRVDFEPRGGRHGTAAALLQPVVSAPHGFVTVLRCPGAAPYRGRRLRLSAWVKAEDVGGWSGLWMRVDPAVGKGSLAFDNMQPRAIRGTRDWRRYQVVLDVAPEAGRICYGFLLDGPGRVWVDDVALDEVGTDVPETSQYRPERAPANLDFDHPPESPR